MSDAEEPNEASNPPVNQPPSAPPPPPPAAPVGGGLGQEISASFAKLGPGEMLVVVGAVIVLADWFLFDLVIDRYPIYPVSFLLAVLVVATAYVHQKGRPDPVPYVTVLFVAGGMLGLMGAWDMIEEIRDNIFGDAGFVTILGALGYYAGAILAGVGALQLRKR